MIRIFAGSVSAVPPIVPFKACPNSYAGVSNSDWALGRTVVGYCL